MRLQEEPREDGANLGVYRTDSWSTAPLFLLDASSDGPSHTHSLPPSGSSSSGYEGKRYSQHCTNSILIGLVRLKKLVAYSLSLDMQNLF